MYPNTMEDRPYRKAAPKPGLLHRILNHLRHLSFF